MLKYRFVKLLAALILATLLLCSGAWSATSPWGLRSGCIGYLTSAHLSEGSSISLDDIVVTKISAKTNPAYIVCSEMFRAQDKILIITSPSPLLRLGQSIDCSGTLAKLDGGQLAVTSPTIIAYTTATGDILYSGLIKGIDKPTPWAFKRDITVAASTSSMRAMSTQSSMPGDPPNTAESVVVEACNTIVEAKAKAAGTAVRLQCKPVASVSSGYFMLGQDGSTDTMKAYYTKSVLASNRVCSITAIVQIEGNEKVLDIDSGPSYDEQIFVGSVTLAAENTIGYAKSLQDGASITLGTSSLGKIVTCAMNSSVFYIEEDDRASGIMVIKSSYELQAGDRAYITGTMATYLNGERYIDASTVTFAGNGLLRPIGLPNKLMGGGDFFYNSNTPVSGQRGITGASGLNNIGLLIRVWGKVKSVDTGTPMSWFKIDDGSGVDLKIDLQTCLGNVIQNSVAVNDYIYATGISSCEISGANLLRVLRPGPVLAPTFNPDAGTYNGSQGVIMKSAMLGETIRYTISGVDPDENSTIYDPMGAAVVDSSHTLKARVYRDSWVVPGPIQSKDYVIIPNGTPVYNCWEYSHISDDIYDLRVDDIAPGMTHLTWSNKHYGSFDVQYDNTPAVVYQPSYTNYVPYTFGTTYICSVRLCPFTEPLPEQYTNLPEARDLQGVTKVIYPRPFRTYAGEWKTISITPQKTIVSENQAVDSRPDTREVTDDVPVDFQFGSRIYRGGLFIGYADTDPSKVGRSYLKFDFTNLQSNMGTNDRLWAGSINAYYTRSAVDGTSTRIGSVNVSNNWDDASLKWSSAPLVNFWKVRTTDTEDVTGSTSKWCSWNSLFADVANGFYNGNTFSAALVSTSETTPGWAYFAKKEYDASLAPNILYAYGKYVDNQSGIAPVFVASIELDACSVKGGKTLKGHIRLNAPAPTGGLAISLDSSSSKIYIPSSVTVLEGKLQADFIISTAIISSDTSAVISTANGSNVTFSITH